MTNQKKQARKNLIKNLVASKKASNPNRASAEAIKEDHADSVRTAEALEAQGKWDEAAIAWGVASDYATTAKDKKRDAGRQAAAKVRASAAYEALATQVEAQAEQAPQVAAEAALESAQKAIDAQQAEAEKATRAEQERQEAAHGVESLGVQAERAAAIDAENHSEAEGEETRPCTPEEMAAEAKKEKATKAKKEKAPKEPKAAATRERDARLPAVGTVLVKKDRAGAERARCTITEAGVEYAGATYKTISAAGLKAMADLGLKATTCDGFAFWGLKKGEPRPAATKPVDFDAIEKAWDRYRERVEAAVKTTDADQRAKVNEMLAKHAEVIMAAIRPAVIATAEPEAPAGGEAAPEATTEAEAAQ